MLSRVANSLYWLARYVERADTAARALRVTHSYAQELRVVSHTAAEQCWTVASSLLAPRDGGGEEEEEEGGAGLFWRLAFDEDLSNSLLSCVTQARENARGIRDAIPSEMWEELNVFHLRLLEEAGAHPSETSELSLLHRMSNAAHRFQGLRDSTMVRADEWHFLRLGQFLEGADMTTRTLDAMFGHPALRTAQEAGQSIDTLHLGATLRTCSGFESFSRSEHSLTPGRVAEFLLLDARFPRSIEFCIQELGYSLHALSGTPHDLFSNDAEQLCGRLVAELRFAGIEEIMGQGLHEYLQGVLGKLAQIGRAVGQMYFR
jgi:uncharacterized alpha-E superfamily protein